MKARTNHIEKQRIYSWEYKCYWRNVNFCITIYTKPVIWSESVSLYWNE